MNVPHHQEQQPCAVVPPVTSPSPSASPVPSSSRPPPRSPGPTTPGRRGRGRRTPPRCRPAPTARVERGLRPRRRHDHHAARPRVGAAPRTAPTRTSIPAGRAPAAGPHFQNVIDPVRPSSNPAYANPGNEIWLDFTTDEEGDATRADHGEVAVLARTTGRLGHHPCRAHPLGPRDAGHRGCSAGLPDVGF